MSRPSVLRTTTAKQAKPTATAVPVSAVNVIPKQGEHLFDHDGVKAVIQFAQHNGQWIAEYRFRFRCGAFHAGIHDRVLANRTTPFEFPRGTDASVVVADILGHAPATDRCTQAMERQKANPTARSNRIEVVGLINGKDCQGYRVASPKGKGFTLCANSGGPGSKTGLYLVSGKPRRLTVRECARMQGFPESFKPHARPGIAKRQFGNSVAVASRPCLLSNPQCLVA